MLNASDLSGKLFPEYVTETSTCCVSSYSFNERFFFRPTSFRFEGNTHTHTQVLMGSTRKRIMLLELVDSKRCTKE